MLTRPVTARAIRPWGTAARVVVGLGAFPLAVTAVVVLRGRHAQPIRFLGAEGHCVNCALILAAFLLLPEEALLFYGTSMLVAAVRGYGGCELFAISNWIWRRDDQIACPLFHVIDHAERRAIAHGAAP